MAPGRGQGAPNSSVNPESPMRRGLETELNEKNPRESTTRANFCAEMGKKREMLAGLVKRAVPGEDDPWAPRIEQTKTT